MNSFSEFKGSAAIIKEIITLLFEAAEDSKLKLEDMKVLWTSREFWNNIMRVILGTHTVTEKTPYSLVQTERLHSELRIAALKKIDSQSTLKSIADCQSLPMYLRKMAVDRIEDEYFISWLCGDDVRQDRIQTMTDMGALGNLGSRSGPSTRKLVALRMYELSPERAILCLKYLSGPIAHQIIDTLQTRKELHAAIQACEGLGAVKEHAERRLAALSKKP